MATIVLPRKFVFEDHRWFFGQIKTADLVIDFRDLEEINTAGIGMLLVANDRVQSMKMINMKPHIEELFDLISLERFLA